MPYIIKNGKTYTGNSVTLTQAQYDALSEVEKNNGTAYYIYDSNAVLDADDVALDNGTVETLAGSVAVIETSPATAIHAEGSYILWNGQLYTVISRIEVGQTLTVGSNITATSAGSELTSLKEGLSKSETMMAVTAGSNVTINNGGYVKFGNIVIVSLKLTTTAQLSTNAILVSGLPSTGRNVYFECGSGYSPNAYSCRTGQDKLYANATIPSGTELNINGSYLVN